MLRISVEEAAMNLKSLLERVARGEEVILLEQDKAVANESAQIALELMIKHDYSQSYHDRTRFLSHQTTKPTMIPTIRLELKG